MPKVQNKLDGLANRISAIIWIVNSGMLPELKVFAVEGCCMV